MHFDYNKDSKLKQTIENFNKHKFNDTLLGQLKYCLANPNTVFEMSHYLASCPYSKHKVKEFSILNRTEDEYGFFMQFEVKINKSYKIQYTFIRDSFDEYMNLYIKIINSKKIVWETDHSLSNNFNDIIEGLRQRDGNLNVSKPKEIELNDFFENLNPRLFTLPEVDDEIENTWDKEWIE